jgi:23S rRNA (guanosine2251-2'-O)-methyltransferase
LNPKPSIISGRNPVIEALKAGRPIEKIFILRGSHGKPIGIIRDLARKNSVVVTEVDKKKFTELTGSEAAQGVAALAGVKKYEDFDSILDRIASKQSDESPFLLILDEITDPHNVGALIRTAECAGVDAVILPKHHSAPLTETVLKTSAGAVEHIPVIRVTNITHTLERLKAKGYWIVGTDGRADKRYDEIDYTSPIAVIIGAEGKGMRRLVKEKCDFLVHIPVKGKIESLNASVAGGIVMYEATRQRTKH